MTRHTAPPALGTIVPGCSYQTIDLDAGRWVTLARGQVDAPNPIRRYMHDNNLSSMWINNAVLGRRIEYLADLEARKGR